MRSSSSTLPAVDSCIGRVEVEDDFHRRFVMRLDEEVQQELVGLLVVEQDLAVAVVLREARRGVSIRPSVAEDASRSPRRSRLPQLAVSNGSERRWS